MYYYVYILESESNSQKYYVGYTTDLGSRIKKHNEGGDEYTTKYKPWKIRTAIAFADRKKSLEFERYLKTGSGRAFVKRHL